MWGEILLLHPGALPPVQHRYAHSSDVDVLQMRPFLSASHLCHTHTADMNLLAGGLQAAYAGPVAFRRDGLLFLHKEGHYDLGTSPLGLLWKDASSSRYFIETDAKGNIPPQQTVVLRCLPIGQMGTGDEPPCPLGPGPAFLAQADIGHLKRVLHLCLLMLHILLSLHQAALV